jgi:D-Tyr-tRNAtyr deacylase
MRFLLNCLIQIFQKFFNLCALIQRVLEAKVVVDGQTTGEIQTAYWFFRSWERRYFRQRQKLIDKILKYRIFDDEQGKMGWNVAKPRWTFIGFTIYPDGANPKRLTS